MENRYWDSTVFLAWLRPEPDRAERCKGVIKHAEKGELKIVTSAITLAEVIKLKGAPQLKEEQEETIKLFFQNDFISIRNLDHFVAEYARNLIWKYSHLKPKDSIHLATAHLLKIRYLDTFDDDFTKLDGILTNPPIKIGSPDIGSQEELEF